MSEPQTPPPLVKPDHPKTFKCDAKRSWTVDLSLASSLRIKNVTGKRIDDFIPKASAQTHAEINPFREFISDPFAVFDVFYALVKPAADAAGLTKEQVMEGFATDAATEAMACAVIQAFVDFFRRHDPARAMILKRHLDLGKAVMARAAAKMEAKLDAINLEAITDAAAAEIDPLQITSEAIARLKNSAANTAAF